MSHDTEQYTLGRGVLYVAEWTVAGPGDYEDVGNCPRFVVNYNKETLDHYSSRSGTRKKDRSITLEEGYAIEFDLDEISRENLARFIKGSLDGDRILGLQNTDQSYAVKFVSDNAAGPNRTWYFHKVTLSPGSGVNLISNDWSVLTFTGEVGSDDGNNPDSPYATVAWTTTTTTTTTTTAP